MRILVIGCGYVGLPLAQALAQRGHAVHGTRRSAFTAEGITSHALDVTDRRSFECLPREVDCIYYTPSSARGDAAVHRAVFVDGTRNLLDWLGDTSANLLFTSSTSVYPHTDGQWVDEECPDVPADGTGANLAEAEALFLNSGQPANVLRVAGIYGPERGYLFRQFLKDQAILTEGGARWINMIHRDDVVGALLAALDLVPGIYNATDDEPVTQRAFFEWLAGQLDKPLPPAGEAPARKRTPTHKRVRNTKLKTAGWQLKFPDFRAGYGALIREEQGGR